MMPEDDTIATTPDNLDSSHAPQLARRVGLFMLVVYGIGDMVGGGIYGTLGVAAGKMGNAVWMSYLCAMIAAAFTGLSYASLASRYPKAAGASFITQRAYGLSFFSYIIGLVVVASGLTSMATNSNVFARYLDTFLNPVAFLGAIPVWVIVLGFILAMTFINFRGIRESMLANILCTAVEVGGLIFVIAVGASYLGSVNLLHTPPSVEAVQAAKAAGQAAPTAGLDLFLIGSGTVLVFFAYLGFEDMLNVAEEVKQPKRNMPLGIIIAIGCTALLYLATSITAVNVVDYHQLGQTRLGAPLAQVTHQAAPWLPDWVFNVITIFAAANTVLINYVMGSRMLYGMAHQRLLPKPLGRVHRRRKTPHIAILTLMIIVIVLAFSGNISQLATATGLLLLIVFCVINAALVILKYRHGEEKGKFEIPFIIPVLGVLCCGGLIVLRLIRITTDFKNAWQAPAIAGGLIVVIAVLYLILRPGAASKRAWGS